MFSPVIAWLIFALLPLLPVADAAFVETQPLVAVDRSNFLLDKFIIDVAMDSENNLLKFFINTQVSDWNNITTTEALIDDVNVTTNKYTTFHVDIDFMGKTFILKNLRFCDMVAVKNTSGNYPSARYPLSDDLLASASSSSKSSLPTPILGGHEGYALPQLRDRLEHNDTTIDDKDLIASSNSSIEQFFSNSTGDLVQCSLYQNDSIVIYYQADISDHRRALGSYNVKFTVVSNDEDLVIIGASQTHVTPVLNPRYLSSILKYSVLVIILLSGAVNYCITIVSPDQESNNPFLVEASTICNAELLQQLEANTNVIVRYFQFAFFMAGLDLQYPGFLQPFIGQIRWCCLLGLNVFSGTSVPLIESDNVFITLHWTGLGALALYGSSNFITYSWANFIICLTVCIGATVAIHQFFIMIKLFVNRRRHNCNLLAVDDTISRSSAFSDELPESSEGLYSISKNAWALLGHALRQFLHTFELAFLVLTFFMFYVSSERGMKMFSNQSALKANAFNFHTPYTFLTLRNSPPSSEIDDSHRPPPEEDPQSKGIPKASIICGSLLMLAWLIAKLYFVFKYLISFKGFRFSHNRNVKRLYTEIKSVLLWAYFYNLYLPTKSYYAIFDFVSLLLQLIVISMFLMNGTVQVILLILLELVRLALLLIIRPYYLKMTWHSLYLVTHLAKISVLFLSIPYIKALSIAEAPRTYVAYIQLVIHLLIVVFFIGHLIYCVCLTVLSYFSAREKKKYEKSLLANNTGKGEPGEDFEYYPVNYRNYDESHESQKRENNPDEADVADMFESTIGEDEEVDYYRAQSDKVLQNCGHKISSPKSENKWQGEENLMRDEESFNGMEYQLRRRRNDYATREGDLIYEKFFSSSNMDPEIRNLWASRLWSMDGNGANALQPSVRPSSGQTKEEQPESWTNKILYSLGLKKKPAITGFEVFRPNKKTMDALRSREGMNPPHQE